VKAPAAAGVPAPRGAVLWACFAGCVAIWSLTWVAIRAGATGAAPIGNGALRATLAAALLVALAVAWRAPRPSWPQAWRLAAAGVVFVGLNFMLVYSAATRIDGSLAALLYATLPLQSALLGPLLVARERFEPRVLLGAAVGAAGVGVALRSLDALGDARALPVALVLLGATTSAVGAGLVRRVQGVHPIWVNAWANAGGAAALWLGWTALEREPFLPGGAVGWAGFAYMVLGASVVAFLLYFVLLRSWSTARTAYSSLAASAGAIAVGVALGEPFTTAAGLGAALVLAGGVLVLARRRPAGAGRPPPAASSPRP
jgi:O-acetylserine/cysteine efflux transporter